MTYALVTTDPMVEQFRLPDSATLMIDPGVWVTDLPNQSAQVYRQTGWYEVVSTARPNDTETHTYTRSLELIGGIPTETWTERAFTLEELETKAIEANRQELLDVVELTARLSRLKAYDTDPEIVAALARANATALTTQDLNRLLKTMLRRDQRQTAAIATLIRILDPSLLNDISDTIEQ